MPIVHPSGTELYHALEEVGFPLPDDCGDVSLTMPVDGLFQLHYTINVSGDDLAKLGRALALIGGRHKGAIAAASGRMWNEEQPSGTKTEFLTGSKTERLPDTR